MFYKYFSHKFRMHTDRKWDTFCLVKQKRLNSVEMTSASAFSSTSDGLLPTTQIWPEWNTAYVNDDITVSLYS